mmetsp:Transcript_17795/g.62399  ORF Transcript_17795/g.62399 Transcript_17795/m.62399 type:complete len:226 (-) Transcript_17795:200-877(-)
MNVQEAAADGPVSSELTSREQPPWQSNPNIGLSRTSHHTDKSNPQQLPRTTCRMPQGDCASARPRARALAGASRARCPTSASCARRARTQIWQHLWPRFCRTASLDVACQAASSDVRQQAEDISPPSDMRARKHCRVVGDQTRNEMLRRQLAEQMQSQRPLRPPLARTDRSSVSDDVGLNILLVIPCNAHRAGHHQCTLPLVPRHASTQDRVEGDGVRCEPAHGH